MKQMNRKLFDQVESLLCFLKKKWGKMRFSTDLGWHTVNKTQNRGCLFVDKNVLKAISILIMSSPLYTVLFRWINAFAFKRSLSYETSCFPNCGSWSFSKIIILLFYFISCVYKYFKCWVPFYPMAMLRNWKLLIARGTFSFLGH